MKYQFCFYITMIFILTAHASMLPTETASITGIDDGELSTRGLGLAFTRIYNGYEYINEYIVERGTATATEITIPETYNFLPVTMIGSFQGFKSLTSITIPSSVTRLTSSAFFGCSSLTSVNFQDISSLTSISNDAFNGCSGLTSINIPNSVSSIGQNAFTDCSSLMSINIPSSVTSIGQNAFLRCSSLININMETNHIYRSEGNCLIQGTSLILGCLTSVIPDNITSIGNAAFSGYSSLISINIPTSVLSIGQNAFFNCSNLTSINIPNNVISIGPSAFYNCSNLTSTNIPSSVTNIGQNAFYGCSSLSSINIPTSVASIGGYVFGNCSSLVIFTAISSQNIPQGWVSGWNGDRPVVWDGGSGNLSFIFDSQWGNYSVERGTTPYTDITIPAIYDSLPVQRIRAEGFKNFRSLTSITIPNSVTAINIRAFENCSGLLNINIPSSITYIDIEAFRNCSSLTSIYIPNSVSTISRDAFQGCSNLVIFTESASQPAGWVSGWNCDRPVVWGNGNTNAGLGYRLIRNGTEYAIFRTTSSVSSLSIPSVYNNLPVTTIQDNGFQNFKTLTNVTIPSSITNIGSYAFDGCSNLTNITIPSSVSSIGQSAFGNCSLLSSINFQTPRNELNINDSAFINCSRLSSINIPNGVEYIRSMTFWGCYNLASVSIPSSVISISNGVFSDCYNLTSIFVNSGNQRYRSEANCLIEGSTLILGCQTSIIPSSVTSIGSRAFEDCRNLTSITIPASVTSIASGVFTNCYRLGGVFIPNNVTNIGYRSFYNCPSLVIFTERSSRPVGWDLDWKDVNISVIWGATISPVAPSNLDHQIFDGAIYLSWTQPTGVYIPNFISYAIYRDGVPLTISSITNPNFIDINPPFGSLTYNVRAIYTSGMSVPTNTITVENDNILPPINLTADVQQFNVFLTWNRGRGSVTDSSRMIPDLSTLPLGFRTHENSTTRSLQGYKVYRGENLLTLDPIDYTYFTDSNLPPGTYTYKVSTVYSNGESSQTEPVYVTIYSIQPPTNLHFATPSALTIALNWDPPISISGLLHYKIYRKDTESGDFFVLTESVSDSYYIDNGLDY